MVYPEPLSLETAHRVQFGSMNIKLVDNRGCVCVESEVNAVLHKRACLYLIV